MYENQRLYQSRFIKNTACPKCREEGKDKHGDNLATYSDGSSYCWACGYVDMGNSHIVRFLARGDRPILDKGSGIKTLPSVMLPDDSVTDYSDKALEWINSYELDRTDLIKNGILWSDSGVSINIKGEKVQANPLLMFTFWNGGDLLGWQGRYFGNDPRIPKWISKGKLDSIYHIFFMGRVGHAMNDATRRIVLVEDVVSALKVSKVGIDAMPLFGVNIKQRWPKIRLLGYSEALLWLDPDMHIKIIKESRVGCLNGITTHAILSTKDPKEHTYEEIKQYIGAQK